MTRVAAEGFIDTPGKEGRFTAMNAKAKLAVAPAFVIFVPFAVDPCDPDSG
jgi:hypothetical protein